MADDESGSILLDIVGVLVLVALVGVGVYGLVTCLFDYPGDDYAVHETSVMEVVIEKTVVIGSINKSELDHLLNYTVKK